MLKDSETYALVHVERRFLKLTSVVNSLGLYFQDLRLTPLRRQQPTVPCAGYLEPTIWRGAPGGFGAVRQ